MLEEQDFEKIGKLIKESEERIVDNVIGQVGDMIEQNVLPQFKSLEDKLAGLADKASVNKMIDASVERDQRLNQKIDTMTGFLAQKKVLETSEVSQLQSIKVFGPLLRSQG